MIDFQGCKARTAIRLERTSTDCQGPRITVADADSCAVFVVCLLLGVVELSLILRALSRMRYDDREFAELFDD